ncbi:MAG: CRTAC1 family protein, partial [Sphingobacteriales bacterium]
MGGAYEGDAYQNSLFINSGGYDNQSVTISLEGTKSNKAAIGARLKISFRDGDKDRIVYREVNSGSSFGANALEQHIGIGKATQIDRLEITWPGTNLRQEFTDIPANQFVKLIEGDSTIHPANAKAFQFGASHQHH